MRYFHIIDPIFSFVRSPSALIHQATCKSEQCKLTANGIISDMDPSVDPCQDFAKFTCRSLPPTSSFFSLPVFSWANKYNIAKEFIIIYPFLTFPTLIPPQS